MTDMHYSYSYPRPGITVDAMLFHWSGKILRLLLIKRGDEPYKGSWAFPGGFVDENETVEEAMVRELSEETGLLMKGMEQVYTASAPGRDPRGWTISVVFLGCTGGKEPETRAGDDAAEAHWHALDNLPDLAFDHMSIVHQVKEIIRTRILAGRFIPDCLPAVFSLDEADRLLQNFYSHSGGRTEILERLMKTGDIVQAMTSELYTFNRRI